MISYSQLVVVVVVVAIVVVIPPLPQDGGMARTAIQVYAVNLIELGTSHYEW